jgi:hypothetical protein
VGFTGGGLWWGWGFEFCCFYFADWFFCWRSLLNKVCDFSWVAGEALLFGWVLWLDFLARISFFGGGRVGDFCGVVGFTTIMLCILQRMFWGRL